MDVKSYTSLHQGEESNHLIFSGYFGNSSLQVVKLFIKRKEYLQGKHKAQHFGQLKVGHLVCYNLQATSSCVNFCAASVK